MAIWTRDSIGYRCGRSRRGSGGAGSRPPGGPVLRLRGADQSRGGARARPGAAGDATARGEQPSAAARRGAESGRRELPVPAPAAWRAGATRADEREARRRAATRGGGPRAHTRRVAALRIGPLPADTLAARRER